MLKMIPLIIYGEVVRSCLCVFSCLTCNKIDIDRFSRWRTYEAWQFPQQFLKVPQIHSCFITESISDIIDCIS